MQNFRIDGFILFYFIFCITDIRPEGPEKLWPKPHSWFGTKCSSYHSLSVIDQTFTTSIRTAEETRSVLLCFSGFSEIMGRKKYQHRTEMSGNFRAEPASKKGFSRNFSTCRILYFVQ